MAKRGRPVGSGKYDDVFVKQATQLAALGATDLEMADFFGVTRSTFYKWKHDHPNFSDSLKSAKDPADDRVERSLYHRAIGYSFDAVKIVVVDKVVEKVPYREHVPPDTTAAIFWLKNRRSRQWREVSQHELGRPGDFDQMTLDELRDSIARDAALLQALGGSVPPLADFGGPGDAG